MRDSRLDEELSRYITKARSAPPLSREVEHELAVRVQQGDEAAVKELVEANLRHAIAVAIQYRGYGLRLADLVSEGSVGLMMAVRKFDPERGTRFVTYAGYWIRAYILDFIVRSTSLVGGGSGALRTKLFFRLRRERARAASLLDDPEARTRFVAERLGMTPERIAELSQRLDAKDVSLDASIHNDSTDTLLDTLVDGSAANDERLHGEERGQALHGKVDEALEHLDPRERFIVESRMMGDEEMSLADIGRKLGVSRERARQLEARAKKKLRRELGDFAVDSAAGWR